MYNECRHIMPSGRKCHSPALSGKPYCYYHIRLHQFTRTAGRPATQLPMPQIEDARGIQIALAQALYALNSPYFEPRRLGHLFYGLQIATQLLKHAEAPEPAETVRTLYDLSGTPVDPEATAASELDTEVLSPDKTVCEPPRDCRNCPKQDSCSRYEEPDEDEEDEEEPEENGEEENDDSDEEEGEDDENEEGDQEDSDDESDPDKAEEDDYDPEEYLDRDEINRRFIRALRKRELEREAHSSTKTEAASSRSAKGNRGTYPENAKTVAQSG